MGVKPYRVEVVHWDGHARGSDHLEAALNDWASDGWDVVSVVPTRAGASIRSLVGTSASADTSELAVVLRRAKR